jgi:hypothetical protein
MSQNGTSVVHNGAKSGGKQVDKQGLVNCATNQPQVKTLMMLGFSRKMTVNGRCDRFERNAI